MILQADAECWTGLQKGGISALALVNTGFRVYLDASVQDFDQIAMSTGERGVQVVLVSENFVKLMIKPNFRAAAQNSQSFR
jgi:prolyl-tRNA editing enzyme YbaK/EbsC (Cys-tRNA(Pro) deacylase)